jgi:NAD(P)-dependent dehydrogenase (short-subunit alcohol dehydrogenase family)
MMAVTRPVYVVTGATSGLGEALATRLAVTGARVFLGARTAESGQAAAGRIRAAVPGADVEVVAADLSEMAHVRGFAERLQQATGRLDTLVLNAGEARPGRALTTEGLETNLATNYLSGFLLTHLLVGLLRASAPARIVTIASSQHTRVTHLDFPALATGADPDRGGRYAASKLCTVLFTTELARRLPGSGLIVNAADPGFLRSGLGRHATGPFRMFLTATRLFQDSPQKAAATPLWLASSPEAPATSGGYYSRCRPGKTSALARDSTAARELWDQTVELLTRTQLASTDELHNQAIR